MTRTFSSVFMMSVPRNAEPGTTSSCDLTFGAGIRNRNFHVAIIASDGNLSSFDYGTDDRGNGQSPRLVSIHLNCFNVALSVPKTHTLSLNNARLLCLLV
jgi:hypothetical protein